MERTRRSVRTKKNSSDTAMELSLSWDITDPARPSKLKEVTEETESCGSAGSDSLYNMSLEGHQQSLPDTDGDSSSTKDKPEEPDFEKVPSLFGSYELPDPDRNSNASSTFSLVITDESNDEETSGSCPVSPGSSINSPSESSLYLVPKKPLHQPCKEHLSEFGGNNHLIDNDVRSVPSSNSVVSPCLSTNLTNSPCSDATPDRPKRKPVTLPRRKVDLIKSPAVDDTSIDIPYFTTDGLSRKQHPRRTVPKRSNSARMPASSVPNMILHKSDKEKPPVAPRRNPANTEDIQIPVPIPKPRRKRKERHTEPVDPVTSLSTFKSDFYENNVSWSAESSPIITRKVNEATDFKLLRPLSTYTGRVITTANSQTKIIPKSASNDELNIEHDPPLSPSLAPAIEMAPFEEDWQGRFMPEHKRRSKTLRNLSMMRCRSQLIEMIGKVTVNIGSILYI